METNYLINSSKSELFNYKNLGSVRVNVDENGNPWFCLIDVCSILGLTNITMLTSRLDPKGLSSTEVGVQTGVKKDGSPAIQNVKMIFVDEGNLYEAIGRSRKPEAKLFMSWVYREVLPMIRKTGMYMTDDKYQELLTNPGKLGEMLINYQKQLDKLKSQNKNYIDYSKETEDDYNKLVEDYNELVDENRRLREELNQEDEFDDPDDLLNDVFYY